MISRQEFESALDDHPDDWPTRLVYADWLDENDDHILAFAQRWMARRQKYAYASSANESLPGPPNRHVWDWWTEGDSPSFLDHAKLPIMVRDFLPRPDEANDRWGGRWLIGGCHYREFLTRIDAERALAVALASAREELS